MTPHRLQTLPSSLILWLVVTSNNQLNEASDINIGLSAITYDQAITYIFLEPGY